VQAPGSILTIVPDRLAVVEGPHRFFAFNQVLFVRAHALDAPYHGVNLRLEFSFSWLLTLSFKAFSGEDEPNK
jgi:hypothetical protein